MTIATIIRYVKSGNRFEAHYSARGDESRGSSAPLPTDTASELMPERVRGY
jgi:hypothetical protein